MRRWLVVFMLLVLPLQFAWAAAAPYCAHEVATASSKHPGHHQHVHQDGSDVVNAGEDGGGKAVKHTDCASCHAGAAATLPLYRVNAAGAENTPRTRRRRAEAFGVPSFGLSVTGSSLHGRAQGPHCQRDPPQRMTTFQRKAAQSGRRHAIVLHETR